MTKRAYITCPLTAALAAKTFGFKYETLDGKDIFFSGNLHYVKEVEIYFYYWNGQKSFLHAEVCYNRTDKAYIKQDSIGVFTSEFSLSNLHWEDVIDAV